MTAGATGRTSSRDLGAVAGPPDLAALAQHHGMRPVGRRPGLRQYVMQLWARRDFIVTLARSGIASSSSQHRLGQVWLVLTPLLQAAVYAVVFGLLLDTSRGIENFIGYLLIGIFLFQYTAKSITEGAKSITGNRKLVQVLSFPRAALPLSVTLRNALSFGPALVVMFVMVWVTPEPEVITWRYVLVVPVVALMTVFNLGLALLIARAVAVLPDVSQVIPFALRIWFYTSGVFFAFDRFAGDQPVVRAVLEANPMHVFLTLGRDALLYGENSPGAFWWQAVAWSFGLLLVGFVSFWLSEERYTRD